MYSLLAVDHGSYGSCLIVLVVSWPSNNSVSPNLITSSFQIFLVRILSFRGLASDESGWVVRQSPSFICRGVYYWRKASRKELVKVKMVTSDDETATDIIVEGDDEEVERFRRELDMREKGKIYVKGLLER